MNKTVAKMKMISIMMTLVTIGITATACRSKDNQVKDYYRDNEMDFETIVEEFHGLYEGELQEAKYDGSTGDIELGYYDEQGKTYTKSIKNSYIQTKMTDLQALYQGDSDFPVFDRATVSYDYLGNIEISMVVRSNRIKGGDGMNTKDVYQYVLIYVDDGYQGDTNAKKYTLDEFEKNWYLLTRTTYSG